MARITVEDCIDKFPSRFELVLVASNRARKLHSGEAPTVERDNDKNTVIALREIADEALTVESVKNDLIEEYQTLTLNEDEEIDDAIYNEVNEEKANFLNAVDGEDSEQLVMEDESIEDEPIEKVSSEDETKNPNDQDAEDNEQLVMDDESIEDEPIEKVSSEDETKNPNDQIDKEDIIPDDVTNKLHQET